MFYHGTIFLTLEIFTFASHERTHCTEAAGFELRTYSKLSFLSLGLITNVQYP